MSKDENPQIPVELQNATVITQHEDKISKCYSTEKYEEFHEAVKKIALEVLDSSDGRNKVKEHSKEAVKEYLDNTSWEKFKVWLPAIIGIVALILNAILIFRH